MLYVLSWWLKKTAVEQESWRRAVGAADEERGCVFMWMRSVSAAESVGRGVSVWLCSRVLVTWMRLVLQLRLKENKLAFTNCFTTSIQTGSALSLSLSLSLSVSLSLCLSVFLAVSVCLSVFLAVSLSMCFISMKNNCTCICGWVAYRENIAKTNIPIYFIMINQHFIMDILNSSYFTHLLWSSFCYFHCSHLALRIALNCLKGSVWIKFVWFIYWKRSPNLYINVKLA